MNPVFATTAFWQPYFNLDPGQVSADGFAAQLEGLRRDYSVRDETINYEHGGRRHTAIHRLVEFPFSCGENYSLLLEYEPNVSGCSRNLFLVDARSGKKGEMGWWDLARWHPYCLRLEEFNCLLEFWNRWDRRWAGQNLPLLLLSQFVGLPDPATRDSLAARAQSALESMVVPGAGNGQLEVPLFVPDGDYRWELDSKLGWVFMSDDYCCYSIRNRPHADSNEGRFPFTAFREMMTEVQQRLDRN